jgi:hypothetical protein
MKSGLQPKEYCDRENINYKRFTNMLYRIRWKSISDPKTYAHIVPLTREYKRSGQSVLSFSKSNNIRGTLLSECATHLNYLDIIEKFKRQKEPNSMNFVQVAAQVPSTENVSQGEIVEKQNDLEIIIDKGVRVLISPNIDSMKIIKIIELLKDL